MDFMIVRSRSRIRVSAPTSQFLLSGQGLSAAIPGKPKKHRSGKAKTGGKTDSLERRQAQSIDGCPRPTRTFPT